MTTNSEQGAGATAGGRAGAERHLDRGMLREAAAEIGGKSLKDGSWFKKLVTTHAKKHQAAVRMATWDALYPGMSAEARAEKQIQRTAIKAAAAGTIASIGASTGELLALLTEGLAAPVGVPIAMLSMGLEAAYTTLLQIDLACDLGSIHGVPFDCDDVGELSTLFAVALDVEIDKKKEADEAPNAPKGLVDRLVDLEEGQVATRIGRKLLEDAVMRNVIPLVGIPLSARWNYLGTVKLGLKTNRYIRSRRAIKNAFAHLACKDVADHLLLIEGAWLLSTADGDVTNEEVMAIALLVDALSPGVPLDLGKLRVDDEDDWLDRLAKTPPAWHASILDTLYLIAGTDRELQLPEKRILRRVGKALGRTIEFDRIEQICRHLDDGEDLPANFGKHAGLKD